MDPYRTLAQRPATSAHLFALGRYISSMSARNASEKPASKTGLPVDERPDYLAQTGEDPLDYFSIADNPTTIQNLTVTRFNDCVGLKLTLK